MLNLASRMVCRTRVYPSRLAGHNTSYIRLFSLSVRTQPVQFRSISAAGRRRVSLLTLFQTGFKPYFKHRLQGSVLQPVPWCFPIEGRSSSALSALHYDNAHLHSRRFGSGPWENDDDGQAPGHTDWRRSAAASAAYPAHEFLPERPLPLSGSNESKSYKREMRTVNVAIGANLLILGAKLITWQLSGSSSMLAEAVHSFVDTVNQALLRLGITSSKRAATALHPYGYMKEKFVWSLVSAVGIFCLGAGVTFANAFTHMMHPPEALENLSLGFIVLLLSGVVEGFSLLVATRSVFAGAHAAGLSFREYVVRGMDPTSVAVMLEDAAAVAGLVFAGVATFMVHLTGNPMYDAMGSFAVGLLLAGTAIFLILQNRSLLIGRSMNPSDLQRVIYLLERDAVVKAVHDSKSEEIGPGIYRFKAEIEFNGDVMVERHMERLGGRDRLYFQIFSAVNTDRPKENLDIALRAHGREMIAAVGAEVDRLEAIIRKAMPSIRHIDLETDRGGRHGL